MPLDLLAPPSPVVLVALLAGLVAALWLQRRPSPAPAHGGRWAYVPAYLGALAAMGPYLAVLAVLVRPGAPLLGDAASHTAIARAIARGLPHGWIDVVDGGFPLGPHYPSVGWLAAAGLLRAGVPEHLAVPLLGHLGTLAAPLLFIPLARAAGARPWAALLGALGVAWTASSNVFTGGFEPFLRLGLLSQALGVPLATGCVLAFVRGRGAAPVVLLTALLVAAHPQLAVTLGALSVPSVLVVTRGAWGARLAGGAPILPRLARAFAAAAATGLALYGPGLTTNRVPFGMPPMSSYKLRGFSPHHLWDWLATGSLVDDGRAPVLTAAWVFASIVLLTRARGAATRAVLIATLGALLLALAGTLLDLFSLGRALLSFLQLWRVIAFFPALSGLALALSAEELARALGTRGARGTGWPPLPRVAALGLPALVLGLFTAFALPSRASAMAAVRDAVVESRDGRPCGAATVDGFDPAQVADWTRALSHGRFMADQSPPMRDCPVALGVELTSPTPLGLSWGAGSHVGVLAVAFDQVRPEEPGSAARAEALGVRALLRTGTRAQDRQGWRTLAAEGNVELSVREGGTDEVGVGCVTRVLRGENAALREHLIAALQRDAEPLRDPRALTELVWDAVPLSLTALPPDDCRADAAHVTQRPREPGAYEATVESPAPVDVVFRASAFPTWVVTVDGTPAPTRVVAPGFIAARVGPGRHEIDAVVSPPPFYGVGLVAALGVLVALARVRREA